MASNNPPSSSNAVTIAGALTYPASNDNSQLQPVPEQPRQPKTLHGLLRFAIEATKAEDAPDFTRLVPMDEERTRFLQQALSAQTVNVYELLKKNIGILSNMEAISSIKVEDPLPEHILTAFQELREYLDDLDVANDFEKIGGFKLFPMCYSCESVELHRWANSTLAQVCQNNPRCQESALRCSFLPVLLHKLKEDKHEDRSLRALSSMIRDYEPAMLAFISQGGCEVLVDMLQKSEHSEFSSAVFLVSYLCQNSKDARHTFIKNNAIENIVEILKARETDAAEYMLNVLVVLLEMEPEDVLPIYQDPALDLKRVLEGHLQIEDVRNGRFIEEREHCKKIIRLAFEASPQVNGNTEGGMVDEEQVDR